MLKTLRITSIIALAATVCCVIAIVVLGLRGDSEILAYLSNPGVVDKAKDEIQADESKKDVESPLVAQLKAFALRIDPPPPPKPKVEVKPEVKPKPEIARAKPEPKKIEPPRPKTSVNAKFTLLATVQCEADPTRSMALLQQSGAKQEWFRQGESVGHLDVDEVRNGSVVFSQGGRNQQELYVPAKPVVKSILKDENSQPISQTGPGSINVTFGTESDPDAAAVVTVSDHAAEPATTESGRVRLQRSRSEISARREATEPIRTRVAPRVRTPKEQKVEIESNISGIQEIMSREAIGDPEQQQKENEAWMKLLKVLGEEKENLEKAAEKAPQADAQAQPEDKVDADADDKAAAPKKTPAERPRKK